MGKRSIKSKRKSARRATSLNTMDSLSNIYPEEVLKNPMLDLECIAQSDFSVKQKCQQMIAIRQKIREVNAIGVNVFDIMWMSEASKDMSVRDLYCRGQVFVCMSVIDYHAPYNLHTWYDINHNKPFRFEHRMDGYCEEVWDRGEFCSGHHASSGRPSQERILHLVESE